MLAVATPERRDGSANLTYLFDACAQILSNSEKGCTIVVKSTVPVGTCDKIEQFLDEKKPGLFRVVSNPEFLAQGSAIDDTLYPSRIVVGTEDSSTASLIKDIYQCFESEFILTDRKSAEMIKYASNDFLALKLSYINEIANLCEIVGADIDTVSFGMGLDPRIGRQYLGAGTGYGGSCFPKDTKALHWLARYHDYELKTIKATIEVNENQKVRLFKKAKKYFKSFRGLTVAILGLSFKPGTDDLREAPSVEVIQLFAEEGSEVRVWDPVAIENFLRQYPDTAIACKTIDDAIHNADICLIMTEWDEVKSYAPEKFASLMKTPIVIDGRNCYKSTFMSSSGVLYDSIGRKTVGGFKFESELPNLKIQ
jgi:UDPglucose 6-dehydrogenase